MTTTTTLAGIDFNADPFRALRADWKAQGMPQDHPYMRLEFPKHAAGPAGLVAFADGTTYGGAR